MRRRLKSLSKVKEEHRPLYGAFKWKMPMVCSDEQRNDVDLSFLNPNCMYESTFLDTKSWSISNWCKCLSRTLLTIGKRDLDIGLKNLTSLLLGSLGMGTTLKTFQSAGLCMPCVDRNIVKRSKPGLGLGELCLKLPVLCFASNSWKCNYYYYYYYCIHTNRGTMYNSK